MRLSEAIELYNTQRRLINLLKDIEEYKSELHLRDTLYGFRRTMLIELYQELLKEIDYEKIISAKIAAIDVLLDERYEAIDL